MGPSLRSAAVLVAGAAILGLVPAVLAHGDEAMDMPDMGMPAAGAEAEPEPTEYPPTYFAHPEHRAVIYSHIALMTAAWVFVLPVSVMFSIARSRYTLVSQFVFVATNAVGVVLSTIYNARTPDLYPNNAHHKLGWLVTWVVVAQVLVSLLGRVAGAFTSGGGKTPGGDDRRSFIPVSTEAMAEHQRWSDARFPVQPRPSNDSGQGTEPNTESLRSHSLSSNEDERAIPLRDARKEYGGDDDDDDDELEVLPALPALPALRGSGKVHAIASKIAGKLSSRAWKVLTAVYNSVDRIIMPLGFIAFCTGIATFGRFFEGSGIFSGLAHWIKGGVFFWLGLFTLGRWSGSFGELGWAWNLKPKSASKRWTPSSEFTESFLIFFYGATNIFLEHLGNYGGEWSAQDLEHISITVLFIGGGLCGMLVESARIRDLLNTTVADAAQSAAEPAYHGEERGSLEEPEAYKISLNPIPALVILLLGIMMSSHTQHSMISSMVHKQWGNLLTGAAIARGLTYVIMYLRPPRSIYPSRPPTELLTSFGLIAGGVMFMASSSDTVTGMIHYELDAMFMYTVVLGFVGLLMAWELTVLSLKGWAVRRETGRPVPGSRSMA